MVTEFVIDRDRPDSQGLEAVAAELEELEEQNCLERNDPDNYDPDLRHLVPDMRPYIC